MRNGYTVIELLFALIGPFLVIGWCINIWKLFSMVYDPVTGEMILRIIGIFAVPFGGIMGWF